MRTRGQKTKVNECDKKSFRILKRLIQANVAQHIEITEASYRKYEKGVTRVSVSTENKIAQLYGMTRVEFVQSIENKINEQK